MLEAVATSDLFCAPDREAAVALARPGCQAKQTRLSLAAILPVDHSTERGDSFPWG
jgi:hypothetical protein